MLTDRKCSEDGCEGARVARGLCCKHYHNLRWETDEAYRERCRATAAKRDRTKANALRRKRWNDPMQRPAKLQALAVSARKHRSGFSGEAVEFCRQHQGGRCAICSVELGVVDKRKLDGEHADHFETLNGVACRSGTKGATKHARGLLCWICNSALGWYELHHRPLGLVSPFFDNYLENYPMKAFSK